MDPTKHLSPRGGRESPGSPWRCFECQVHTDAKTAYFPMVHDECPGLVTGDWTWISGVS